MVEVGWREVGDARRQIERRRVGELERRREVELAGLALNRGHDRSAVMSGVAAPQSRGAVENLPPLRRVIMHVLGARDEARALLEGAVRRERQPERREVV